MQQRTVGNPISGIVFNYLVILSAVSTVFDFQNLYITSVSGRAVLTEIPILAFRSRRLRANTQEGLIQDTIRRRCFFPQRQRPEKSLSFVLAVQFFPVVLGND